MAVQRRVRQKARHVGAQAVRAETGAVRDGRFDVEVGFFVVELCLVDVDVFFVVVDMRLGGSAVSGVVKTTRQCSRSG